MSTAWRAALVLLEMTVITYGDLDVLSVGVVVFAPALSEGIVEEFIISLSARCLVRSASASCQVLLQFCMYVRIYSLLSRQHIAEVLPLLPCSIHTYGITMNKVLNIL